MELDSGFFCERKKENYCLVFCSYSEFEDLHLQLFLLSKSYSYTCFKKKKFTFYIVLFNKQTEDGFVFTLHAKNLILSNSAGGYLEKSMKEMKVSDLDLWFSLEDVCISRFRLSDLVRKWLQECYSQWKSTITAQRSVLDMRPKRVVIAFVHNSFIVAWTLGDTLFFGETRRYTW